MKLSTRTIVEVQVKPAEKFTWSKLSLRVQDLTKTKDASSSLLLEDEETLTQQDDILWAYVGKGAVREVP